MSDQSEDEEKHHHHHHEHHASAGRRSKDKKMFHHNHYRKGSVQSSYTAINGAGPPRTTPFRPCRAKTNVQEQSQPHAKKQIEIVLRQGGQGVYAPLGQGIYGPPPGQGIYGPPPEPVQQPITYGPTPLVVQQPNNPTYYSQQPAQYPPPIYEPPPPARRYEVYRRTEEDERRFRNYGKQDESSETQRRPQVESIGTGTGASVFGLVPPDNNTKVITTNIRRNRISFEDEQPVTVARGNRIRVEDEQPITIARRNRLIVEDERPVTIAQRNRLIVEDERPFTIARRNRIKVEDEQPVTIARRNRLRVDDDEDEEPKEALTVGTGQSMIIDPGPTNVVNSPAQKLIILKRSMHNDTHTHYENFNPSGTIYSELSKSVTEVKGPDLCPLCHKGWYVKKFTWSGIIAAIFCFPCGILFCFKMRTYVCSFCGEEPVADYKDYKEDEMEKTPGRTEDSRSRLIPPQKPSNWTKEVEAKEVQPKETVSKNGN